MDQDTKEILEQLGLSNFEEGLLEGDPPVPVDKEKLRAYWEKSLSPREEAIIGHLLSNYKAWDDALDEIMLEDAAENTVRQRLTAAVWIQLIMRKRAVMVASAATLILLIGVFLWGGGDGGGFRDGNNLVAFRDGKITGLEEYGDEWSAKAGEAISHGLELPDGLREIKGAVPGVRAGRPKSPVLVQPYGSAVRGTSPVFEWNPFSGILEYGIELRNVEQDELDGAPMVIDSITERQPVRLDRQLQPGQIYEWRLKYEHEGISRAVPRNDQRPALFRVLTADELVALQAGEEHVGDSHLLRFLVYTEFGLLHEAQTQLDLLRQQNPNSNLMNELEQRWEEFQQ